MKKLEESISLFTVQLGESCRSVSVTLLQNSPDLSLRCAETLHSRHILPRESRQANRHRVKEQRRELVLLSI